MFTGIVQSIGTVVKKQQLKGDLCFVIQTFFKDYQTISLGDSIACDGVCLTVTQLDADKITLDVSRETLAKTTLGSWQIGQRVNLEQSLTLQDKLGGHLVSGHVDALAQCVGIEKSARCTVYRFAIPQHLDKYIVKKGSVALNGVSLTVNTIHDLVFSVNLIPHTLAHTNLGLLKINQQLNIEIDTIARYVEKMIPNFKPNLLNL